MARWAARDARARGGHDDCEALARTRADGQSGRVSGYLNAAACPTTARPPGNRGVTVLRRADGDVTHFLLITHWDSWAAIAAFAGDPVDRARYYPEDDDFLLEREPNVVHYDVAS